MPFGKRYIATYFVCGVDVDVKKRKKHISKTPIKRIQTQQPLSCGSKVWCVLEDGANWKADYVDNIAAAQMGKDGKTVFIRQWHVVRDPEARFQQTERWLP